MSISCGLSKRTKKKNKTRRSTGPRIVSVSRAWLTIQGLRKIVPWRLMPLLAFIQAATSARCRSISTARQIYCVMDGRGKLQIVLSLKDRLCLTFPAPPWYDRPCFEDRSLYGRNYPLQFAIAILTSSDYLPFFNIFLIDSKGLWICEFAEYLID